MAHAFLTGTVLAGTKPCPAASVTIGRLPAVSLDGAFIAAVHKTGTYTVTAHAPGMAPASATIAVAKLDGKAKQLKLKLKPARR